MASPDKTPQQIAADFADIPFANHEAKILALAFIALEAEAVGLRQERDEWNTIADDALERERLRTLGVDTGVGPGQEAGRDVTVPPASSTSAARSSEKVGETWSELAQAMAALGVAWARVDNARREYEQAKEV